MSLLPEQLSAEVMQVYNSLTPKPPELLVPNRRYLREGEVLIYNPKQRRKKTRYLFLFNDALLITKKEGKKKYWLKVFISLRTGLKVQDVTDSTNDIPDVEFRIYAPKKTFIAFGLTPKHKRDWLKAIGDCIDAIEGASREKEKKQIEESYRGTVLIQPEELFKSDPAPVPNYVQTVKPVSGHAVQTTTNLGRVIEIGPLPTPTAVKSREEENVPIPILPPPPGTKAVSSDLNSVSAPLPNQSTHFTQYLQQPQAFQPVYQQQPAQVYQQQPAQVYQQQQQQPTQVYQQQPTQVYQQQPTQVYQQPTQVYQQQVYQQPQVYQQGQPQVFQQPQILQPQLYQQQPYVQQHLTQLPQSTYSPLHTSTVGLGQQHVVSQMYTSPPLQQTAPPLGGPQFSSQVPQTQHIDPFADLVQLSTPHKQNANNPSQPDEFDMLARRKY